MICRIGQNKDSKCRVLGGGSRGEWVGLVVVALKGEF